MIVMDDFHQDRLLRFEVFMALGFGLVDCSKLVSAPKKGAVGKVSYYRWGDTY